jgi:branched-subunit amino acid permease
VALLAGDYWFCALTAYLTIAACIALCFAVVCISYTVLRMLQGSPVPDKVVTMWGVAGWVVGFLLATIFAANGLLGPYKVRWRCVCACGGGCGV